MASFMKLFSGFAQFQAKLDKSGDYVINLESECSKVDITQVMMTFLTTTNL